MLGFSSVVQKLMFKIYHCGVDSYIDPRLDFTFKMKLSVSCMAANYYLLQEDVQQRKLT